MIKKIVLTIVGLIFIGMGFRVVWTSISDEMRLTENAKEQIEQVQNLNNLIADLRNVQANPLAEEYDLNIDLATIEELVNERVIIENSSEYVSWKEMKEGMPANALGCLGLLSVGAISIGLVLGGLIFRGETSVSLTPQSIAPDSLINKD